MITGLKLVYFFFLIGPVKCLVLHQDIISADFLLNLVEYSLGPKLSPNIRLESLHYYSVRVSRWDFKMFSQEKGDWYYKSRQIEIFVE